MQKNFENYGYQILENLSHNYQEGRLTYKAINIASGELVIIKQFRFVTGVDWSAHKQVEREIEVLKSLNHGGIPRYLSSFDLEDGFCLVQEYKEAIDLSHSRSFTTEEIKEITIQLLEILIYLQNRNPLIVHRDIKPENILVDIPSQSPLKNGREIKVYLVDFGLARIGGEITALSSMVAGTTGFMPPEQLLNKSLTAASDLYGLGATLICLLTEMKSTELGELVDYKFRINYT
jgi:serine/threonine protein kinase